MINKMKVIEKKTVEIEAETVVSVNCDFCGEYFIKDWLRCEGYGQIKIEFGYPSNFDGDVWGGEICDDCFRKLFKDKLRLEFNYLGLEDDESIH